MKSTLTRIARVLYLILSWLFVAGVVYQVYLAGLAAVAKRQGWEPHVQLGHTLGLPILFMLPAMYAGRLPTRVKLLTWLLFLVYVLQADVLIFMSRSAPYLAAVHPVLALADFSLGVWLAAQALASVGNGGRSIENMAGLDPAGVEGE